MDILSYPKAVTARWRNRQNRFRYELAITAVFKDEGPYLDEWLTFHAGVGVEHFYLYNNRSSDNSQEVLAPWVNAGYVTLVDWPQTPPHDSAYQDCLKRFYKESRWIAFLDIDEFLYSPQIQDLRSVLPRYGGVAAVFVYWHLFGSSGHIERPVGSVIESYERRLDEKILNKVDSDREYKRKIRPKGVTGSVKNGKAIVNPRLVRRMGVHEPESIWLGSTVDEALAPLPKKNERKMTKAITEVLCINHYWSKSIDELREKVEKNAKISRHVPNVDDYLLWEKSLNGVEDKRIRPIWEKAKEIRPVSAVSS